MSQTPKSKSIQRAVNSATAKDAKARDKTKSLDSFVNFAHNLGIGSDNPMTSSTYGFNPVTRNRVQLEWIHRGSWLGGVAVDVVADDMTRAGVEIKSSMPPKDVDRLHEVATSLQIWKKLNEAIKWSRLYGGAIAVMLIDGQDIETPLRLNTIRKGQFCGLAVLDRWMVQPSLENLVTDFGPDLGKPKFYTVNADSYALSRCKIHHSRVIRLEGIELPYWQRVIENLWGLSVLERLYDRMIAFDSATTGAAQLVYKSYMRTYKIEGMREVVAAGGDALKGLTAYVNQMRRFQGIEGITLIDGKDDVSAESHSAFAGLSDALTQFAQQLSGALQIPLVRLFGQSPTGFSTGDTDLRNYYDTIKQKQETDLRVGVSKIYRAMAASEGLEYPEGTQLEFRPLWQLSDVDKANIAQTVGTVVHNLEESGLIDRATGLKELRQISHVTGVFSNITEEQIKEAEQEGPPVPEAVEVAEIRATKGAQSEPDLGVNGPDSVQTPGVGGKDARMLAKRARDGALPVRAAGILFVTRENKILLMKRDKDSVCPGTWGIPAGKIEEGETTIDTALRECREETGYDYKGLLKVLDVSNGFVTHIAEIEEPFEVKLNDEHTEFKWCDHETNLHPHLMNMIAKFGVK